ncbi:MAG: plasmid stabilization protein [Candidatus Taylorbacteria bacterium CG11_big_fil_rev_8_21_14_0_20_46_11]|uniref:Plasmid stabilization protein n=1 Tax=Candidatus Taylorbacteria bacterium CG11_big_fil_rev_8_21_14_0_20_46_11 TaxID=1975025 RepID=A0A2H0KD24_9BACT|nr:MAG: plasmid stabilization protein [Candidatus Taylorbacteria bacterium CG11_big_fil_rev_8_21_14_0_20_46_11]
MINIKVIKTEEDYRGALKLVEELMSRDPNPDSTEGEQLSLLTALIQDYETKNVPETLPDPIEAIKFRMEQAGLKPTDLVPYIGSRSRVSEILSGKRQLTLDMVRALSNGLGIPAKVLIKKPDEKEEAEYQNWDNRLVTEMETRGYFGSASLKKSGKIELLKDFFSLTSSPFQMVGMLRKSSYRLSPLTNKHALSAWANRVVKKAQKIRVTKKYKHGSVDIRFLQELVKLSVKENGPILAQEYLKKYGIILVIEPHFSKTYLDGAAILVNKDNPIVGLTLRYDRVDNFWFTLLHELAHIARHYDSGISLFYDEIEGVKAIELDEKEKEADALAEEIILPKAKWEISPARLIPSSMAANSLASELGVHVALIAGQIRHKGNKYVYLNKIVNEAKVRNSFPKEKWNK